MVNEVFATSSVFDAEIKSNFVTELTKVETVNVASPDVTLKTQVQNLLSAVKALKQLSSSATDEQKAAQALAKSNVKAALAAFKKTVKTSGASIVLTNNTVTLKNHQSLIKSSVSTALKLLSSFSSDKKKAVKNIKNLQKAF